jgi:hypothetical protein
MVCVIESERGCILNDIFYYLLIFINILDFGNISSQRTLDRIFSLLSSFSDSDIEVFKTHFNRIYGPPPSIQAEPESESDAEIEAEPEPEPEPVHVSPQPSSGKKVRNHTPAYRELVECMEQNEYTEQDEILDWVSFGVLPAGDTGSQQFSRILAHTKKLKKGGDRLELICSVSVIGLYRADVEARRKDGFSLNSAKSAARELVKIEIPELCEDSDMYLVKKLAALEFLQDLCKDNMDVLLLKKMSYKRLMALSAYDKKTLLKTLRCGNENWEELLPDFRSVFE